MNLRIPLLFVLWSTTLWASSFHRPASVSIDEGRAKAVFIDIQKADYSLVYDLDKKSVMARSVIVFEMEEAGKPIFDLKDQVLEAQIDADLSVEVKELSLDGNVTTVRYVDKNLEEGEHTLIISNPVNSNVKFEWFRKRVSSAFWTSDLNDRMFLEQYLPTNLEYDQYKVKLNVKVIGTTDEHEIFTNGVLVKNQVNDFSLEFPEYYNASSIFFHLTPAQSFERINTQYNSIDGRIIPITIYGKRDLEDYKVKTLDVLAELEKDYGPWPHLQVVIYAAGAGGMEYCGATISDLRALGHELTHSYFARGVMPARGNSGWLDEAMASWRDKGYPQISENQLDRTCMAAHSPYRRSTDRKAYTSGAFFLGHLDRLLSDKGGLKKFMRQFFEDEKFSPIFTSDFKEALQDEFELNFDNLFDKYIYGKESACDARLDFDLDKQWQENPYHPHLSAKQLRDLL